VIDGTSNSESVEQRFDKKLDVADEAIVYAMLPPGKQDFAFLTTHG
jgi:hypothetical protein